MKINSLLVAMADEDTAQQAPVCPPVHRTTTFVIDDALNQAMEAGDYRAQYLYTRMGNPTTRSLERRLAQIHTADECVVTASGMGAISAAFFALTAPGDTILVATQLYGVTASFLERYLAPSGRVVVPVDALDTAAVRSALRAASVSCLFVETISNPLVEVAPLDELAALTEEAGVRLMVDNTFANPVVCRPHALGAHVLVIESLSKSISGHSDVHGGAICGTSDDVRSCWEAMFHFGACLDPHAAMLIWRGMRTMGMRTKLACENAAAIASALSENEDVRRVYYPSSDRPAHLSMSGSMLSFVLEGGDARALRFMDQLRTIVPATSLGGVESLVSLPFNTSHRTAAARKAVGLLPGTIRLSVGCEDAGDLNWDLRQAITASAS